MRPALTLLALLPLLAQGADNPPAEDAPDELILTEPRHEVVVSANRDANPPNVTPASISRLRAFELQEIRPQHQSDVLNRRAGIYVQRGSGRESLTAIRSPVLAGAGACGAFLVAEDSIPIRPTGFCNLNEMFETNFEQAGAIEILRGPGSAFFGASAVHGIVNVISPELMNLPEYSFGAEYGADSFKRLRAGFAHNYESERVAGRANGLAAYGTATRAPGWRDASGVDEAKVNLLAGFDLPSGTLDVRFAGTVLNQETAGFVQGFNAYRNETLARGNANPEAFRDASSARLTAHYDSNGCFGKDHCNFQANLAYRRSRMDFIQHFLVGKPFEHNAQTSFLLNSSLVLDLNDLLTLRAAVDAEVGGSELTEFQRGPATDGAPAANAIRPAGYHYNYTVASNTMGATAGADLTLPNDFIVTAALRADRTRYDYDNHMLAGNTRDNGTPCGANGCLYSRPADRSDTFSNVSPRVTVGWQKAEHFVYLSASSGFRPPEMTELYRLQRQQSVADLDSEELEALELGWKWQRDQGTSLSLAAYDMRKRHVILRDANAFNIGNGSTSHRGVEYELRWRFAQRVYLFAAGTFARHEYTFSRNIEQGEVITQGNDVDTAPRQMHSAGASITLSDAYEAGFDVAWLDRYYVDAANTASYPGHTVANARLSWHRSYNPWRVALRVNNLLDTAYADRADFAFGNYRYFPAQGRAVYLSIDYSAD
jgi:iron complex outermembrane recepter protein